MLRRVILLPDGNPTEMHAFSGITHFFTAALGRVCAKLGVAFSVVGSPQLCHTEELLRRWASKGNPGTGYQRSPFLPEERGLTHVLQAAGATEFAEALKDYYESNALAMRRLLARRLRSGDFFLSMNCLDPHVGRADFPLCYYLDCSVVRFYLDPLYGTVPERARVEPIRAVLSEIEATTISSAERVYTFSTSARNELLRANATTPSRCEVVGAGINFTHYPAFIPRKHGGRMNLLFVGRDFDRKGGRTVLEAARFLDSNRFAVTCVTSLQSLTSLSEQPGVHILAPVSKRSLHSLLLGSDLFLAPTKLEPYGLAVAEAMAFSLPVLASAVSAIPEILGSDNPGLLGEHPDGEELASAVLQFANDECLYATTALRNYLRAHLSFHWDRVAYTILNSALYHRLWV